MLLRALDGLLQLKVHLCQKEIARERRKHGRPYLATRVYTLKIFPEPADKLSLDESTKPIEVRAHCTDGCLHNSPNPPSFPRQVKPVFPQLRVGPLHAWGIDLAES